MKAVLQHILAHSVHSHTIYCIQLLKQPQGMYKQNGVYLHGGMQSAIERNEALMYATPWIHFGNVMTCTKPHTLKNPHVV